MQPQIYQITGMPVATAQPVQQMTNVPPMPSNQMGTGRELFSPQSTQNAQGIYGGLDQRQNAVNAPMMFTDQTGDGKITQADVIQARTKGYKK